MFSGIIEHKAKILDKKDGRFVIENHFGNDLKIGQSIAHDGACMTIETFDSKTYSFFAMEESLNKTNFGEKNIGETFNVERCLQVGDRIDGHFVSGHIDTTGKVQSMKKNEDDSMILTVEYSKDFSDLVIPKGSITLNGTSLTITNRELGLVSVWLIPLTQEITNLGDLKIGDQINIEFDMFGKYIQNFTQKS
ncbi:riboflavin synthase [Candidatus Gracilibacteria bacterium]|nr:riboflavin synthase [Candidatus Gracilibacteria bacterium]